MMLGGTQPEGREGKESQDELFVIKMETTWNQDHAGSTRLPAPSNPSASYIHIYRKHKAPSTLQPISSH